MDLGIYGAYFSHARTLAAILIPLASLLFLYLFFRRNRDPQARSWSLGLMMLSSIFLWLFLGLSLTLCSAFSSSYEFHEEATVMTIFGQALLFALAVGVPLAVLLRSLSPRIILSKVKNLSPPSPTIRKSFVTLSRKMGVSPVRLRLCKMDVPISFALDGKRPMVVISEKLLSLLKRDELEAVMAHELAHIKNSDTALKAFVTAYRTALPHDPVIRLVEAAFHREREMAADETAIRTTGEPLALASALLKIYEAFPKNNFRSYGTFSILGFGSPLTNRHPPLIKRVNQLISRAQA